MKYIIALDQGTSSSRALLFDQQGKMRASAQKEFKQLYPHPGWVEHDPASIWGSQYSVLMELMDNSNISWADIAAIGITNQRETTLVWDRETGEPVYNAIVWQDKRTSSFCEELGKRKLESYVINSTGLRIDAYFSGTKINWILEHVEGAREKAKAGKLCFGTVDTYLIWKLTEGRSHKTDFTNASRTMLFNINTLEWDAKLLDELEIPAAMLPEVQSSRSHYGNFIKDDYSIPILGVAGDQQAALFGQCCFERGQAKNTYGTGCFLLMNVGKEKVTSHHGLLTTLIASPSGGVEYALEGSVFVAGAAIQWLRDGLELFEHAKQTEQMANDSENDEVTVVPAFAGLGAPYWDMYARGAIFGLTRDTNKNDIVKATLESLAFQTRDVLEAMEQDCGSQLKSLKVDGGMVQNNFLMQFQANILGVPVERPVMTESTAQGVAYLAGLECNMWTIEELVEMKAIDTKFKVEMTEEVRSQKYDKWKNIVQRIMMK